MAPKQDSLAVRGMLLHCLREPVPGSEQDAVEYFSDGLLVVRDGRVEQAGHAETLLATLAADVEVRDYTGKLIVPGFIDVHTHYPQTDIIAAYGEQLLEWLERYVFPAERRFADAAHAREVADFFIDELLRNGTTTALVLCSVHAESVDALFQAARTKNMRIIAGKKLMDRNCPEFVRDTPESGYRESKELIERWHGRDRSLYAITPRFAPCSSEAQLERAGELAQEYPDVFVHTHLAENKSEVAWVADLFPWSRSYLDVYDRYGLLRERAVFAHCIHLNAEDRARMAESGAAIAFCPTSNLFLGSGLFDLEAARGIRVGLATDVGAGTSFNMLRTMSEAYKVVQLGDQNLTPYQALYLATLGAARALYVDDEIGNFAPGKEADFVVLDLDATPLMARRMQYAEDISEKLFALIMLGDDRSVVATYVMGRAALEN